MNKTQMEVKIYEAFKQNNGEFKFIFDSNLENPEFHALSFTSTQLNQETGEVFKEIFYLHQIDRDSVSHLIYHNGKADGSEVAGLERGLTKYIKENID